MDGLVQDLSRHWFADEASGAAAPPESATNDEALSASMKEALDALAERVNAARCVV